MLRKSGGFRRLVLKPTQRKQIIDVFAKKLVADPAETMAWNSIVFLLFSPEMIAILQGLSAHRMSAFV